MMEARNVLYIAYFENSIREEETDRGKSRVIASTMRESGGVHCQAEQVLSVRDVQVIFEIVKLAGMLQEESIQPLSLFTFALPMEVRSRKERR